MQIASVEISGLQGHNDSLHAAVVSSGLVGCHRQCRCVLTCNVLLGFIVQMKGTRLCRY